MPRFTAHRVLPQLLVQLLLAVSVVSPSRADPVTTDAKTTTDSYRPTYRSARQLIDTIQPLFAKKVRFSSDGAAVLFSCGDPAISAQIAELLPKLDHPLRLYQIELSSQPQAAGTRTYSTDNGSLRQQTFTLTEGSSLTLLNETHAQTVTSLHPRWRQVTTIPIRGEYLQLKVQGADRRVYVSVQMQALDNGSESSIDTTVSGEIGHWIHLSGPAQPENTRVTTTASRQPQALYVKVSGVQ